ncbi:hypothetical protein CEXT_196041 [Caerostris extrusa]|uniref:Uncharacterized protein n=1 Tax=Caerostris extrusa TaxID=172846 RepID=A0AAV4XQ45_CAEEX|nr:hypothetical protein CEXT_196041 [Caerostris extrusa]
MEDEALWPFGKQSSSSTLNQINQPLNQINQPLNQINNSRQQSISSDIHQRLRRDAATEMASQYGDPNQNSYNPSDYEIEPFDHLFTGMRYIEENDVLSTHLQLPPEGSNAFMNQNPQNYESLNSEHPENTPMSVATPCVLPGFQHTFDRRNFISYATHPSESSVNCEKYSKDQSLGGAACTSQNMDAPQKRKNHFRMKVVMSYAIQTKRVS